MTTDLSNEDKLRDYLRRVTLELHKTRARLEAQQASDSEPIAVVGMACRLPGGIDTPAALWGVLERGENCSAEFPRDRGWDVDALYDPDPASTGKSTVRRGGFLRDVERFDAAFFGMSPREALATDPQQRILLEIAWEALERAQIDPLALQGSATGVFCGLWYSGYAAGADKIYDGLQGYMSIGSASSVASGRIAYLLGLHGPTLSVDTACSSSLVATHLAARSLKQGECNLALAGGVTVMATPGMFVEFSRQRNLAPDGHCKPFSARADGTAWSEGAALLVLERLSDAQRNQHPILGLICGSAVNQDGRSQGLTAPNGPAQREVIGQALRAAKLTAADIDVVEAHGTGTTLGDPIEAAALLASYGRERGDAAPLLLGSLKSNLGHTQAAAGVAGVMKILLAFEHGLLPKSLFAEDPTPHVDWSSGSIQLASEALPWPAQKRPRRAGVSSFGFSGTNAHVILEEPPLLAAPRDAATAHGYLPFVLSAKSATSLALQAARLREQLERTPDVDLSAVARALVATRSSFEQRAVIVAHTRSALIHELAAMAQQLTPVPGAPARRELKLAYLFTGQGSQCPGMGRQLYERYEVFRAALDEVFAGFAGKLPEPLARVMFAAPDSPAAALLDQTAYTQAALFALETALFRLLQAWGLEPAYLLGHSVGEIAAAHVAGVMSLTDACTLVAARGTLMQALPATGKMAQVALAEAPLLQLLAGYEGRVSIAAVNGEQACVISGDADAVDELVRSLVARGQQPRLLSVSHAFHSAHMEPMLARFRAVLEALPLSAATIPIVSNVTGELAPPELHASPEYWLRHVREAVRFAPGVRALDAAGANVYLELGPRGVLSSLVHDAPLAQHASVVSALLRGDRDESEALLSALGAYHAAGGSLRFERVLGPGACASLPTYPFARERYWIDARAGADAAALGLCAIDHPLLCASTTLAEGDTLIIAGRLALGTPSWLADHVLFGEAVLPGSALLELANAAARRVGLDAVEELTLEAPLLLPRAEALQIQVLVGELDAHGMRALSIHSRSEVLGEWKRHARGLLAAAESGAPMPAAASWPPAGASAVACDDLYQRLAEVGLDYGPMLRAVRAVYKSERELCVELELPESARLEAGKYVLHPVLLDAALHTLALDSLDPVAAGPRIPFAWRGVRIASAGASSLRARLTRDPERDSVSLRLEAASGLALGAIEALHLRAASASRPQPGAAGKLLHVAWPERALPDAAQRGVVLGGAPELPGWQSCASLAALRAELDAGAAAPEVVLVEAATLAADGGEVPEAALARTGALLEFLQVWLGDNRLSEARLTVLTRGALAVAPREAVELRSAPVWGLVRTVQVEHPDRGLALLDLDASPKSYAALPRALASCEPQLALREGVLRVPRLAPAAQAPGFELPASAHWSLQVTKPGTFDGLELLPSTARELGPSDVRVAVRAAGINFRDVLATLGMYPGDPGPIGYEGSGIVAEVGSAVTRLAPGERVFGMLARGFAPSATQDHRYLTRIPGGLDFERAAGIPLAFLTAYYALHDLAQVGPGEKLLVHAAAGGVGMAALQLGKHFGLELFATASEAKWDTLRALGIAPDHIASSRTLEFEAKFRALSGGGVDVVLDSLAGEFVDASLRLTRPAGRFIEMGKADVRDAAAVAAAHHGVRYRAFDLSEAGAPRTLEMLDTLAELFASGVLQPLPTDVRDLREAREAFRFMAQARHVGKLVLRVPQPLGADGTVLISGGSGALAAHVARHLVQRHGVRQLLLCSRSGGGEALERELTALGAEVRRQACDVSQRAEVEQLLRSIDARHPLCAIVHVAGTTDDGVLQAQDPQRLRTVFAPKVHGAFWLHELTRALPLHAFVTFSSLAGVLGGAGQANYAAANAFLDALAMQRSAAGQVGQALAFGLWDEASGLGAGLQAADLGRMARAGLAPLAAPDALALLDGALRRGEAQLVPIGVSPRLAARAPEALPPLMAALAHGRSQRGAAAAGASFAARYGALPQAERPRFLLDAVRAAVSSVLRIDVASVLADRALKDLGLDSLMAVELRNHLSGETGLRLSSTLLFDHPTPEALQLHLAAKLGDATAPAPVKALNSAHGSEPIAIVAISCRYPGGAHTPEALWRILLEEKDAMTDLPSDRGWDLSALFDPDPNKRGTSTVLRGAFVHDAAQFDPGFFGISPREALAMDPQQRLLLELAWEAFENAGIDPARLRGKSTGVYVGLWSNGYGAGATQSSAPELEGFMAVGTAASVASGRIAYCLGLEGPALSVDTACSSSLVALHLACQALRDGDCDLALAGGVTIMATPATFIEFSRQRNLAPDGRCKAFSADADGTAWGEGGGILALERLSDAQAHGRKIVALIRGSAVNQDGRSQGLTAPNGPAQARVIAQALANAGLSANQVDAVEAHGTGTVLGDPIEAQALLDTYGAARTQDAPLWLGSLKSNLGHTQAAAGVGGVIKMALALQHELLPKTLYAEVPTPYVEWSKSGVRLLQQAQAWKPNGHPRRAGVSSFGMSGTNAHVVLEQAPARAPAQPPSAAGPLPCVLAAKTEAALLAQAAALQRQLEAKPELALADVAASLAHTRASFAERAVIVAADRASLVRGLGELAAQVSSPLYVRGRADIEGKLAFVFPGQGAQWLGMARTLSQQSRLFAEQLEACQRALAPFVDWSLAEVLAHEDFSIFDRIDVLQPVLFAIMVSLAAVWREYGVVPDAVIGHSQGEVAAAYVAGALSLSDAARVVALRSKALRTLSGRGAMAVVELAAAALEPYLARHEERVSIAAINGSASTIVSGQPEALSLLIKELEQREIVARRMRSDVAGHGAQIDAIKDELLGGLACLRPQSCAIPIYSTVSGERVDGAELDAGYWFRNVRGTVQFSAGLTRMLDDGYRFFAELSPHPVLRQAIEQLGQSANVALASVGSLRRDDGGIERLLLSLSQLYARGLPLDLGSLLPAAADRHVRLPNYAFQREPFWLSAGAPLSDASSIGLTAPEHPLLSAISVFADGSGALFAARFTPATHAFLYDTKRAGAALVSAGVYLELALCAAQALELARIDELAIEAPLQLPERAAVTLQICVGPAADGGGRSFSLYARSEADGVRSEWKLHAQGKLSSGTEPAARVAELVEFPPPSAEPLETAELYERLAATGALEQPAKLQAIEAAYTSGAAWYLRLALPPQLTAAAAQCQLHPHLFDALCDAAAIDLDPGFVPLRLCGIASFATGAGSARGRLGWDERRSAAALALTDETGMPLLQVERIEFARVAGAAASATRRDAVYGLRWSASSAEDLAQKPFALLGEQREPFAEQAAAHWPDLPALQAALDGGAALPARVVHTCYGASDGAIAEVAYDRLTRTRSFLRSWVEDERLAETELVIVTRGAVGAGELPEVDLVHAPIWGLVRTLQFEQLNVAVRVVDLDTQAAGGGAWLEALRSSEPQLALRAGALLVPRVVAQTEPERADAAASFQSDGTVLITGDTGVLEANLAAHLVARHGVRQLLLCSRTGARDPLLAELESAGVALRVAACDVTDRAALSALLDTLTSPLVAVIHTAGTLAEHEGDDDPAARAFQTALAGALHLHELTAPLALQHFVMFSSFAGLVGFPGQAPRACAYAALDALAHARRARGLPALSLDWGTWTSEAASDAFAAHLVRSGVQPLTAAEGLGLFDLALTSCETQLVVARLDAWLLRATEASPAVLRGHGKRRRRSLSAASLKARLAELPPPAREQALVDAIRAAAAAIMGARAEAIAPDQDLMELGMDSLMAVELRNQLAALTGLRMPGMLVFDCRNPAALAAHILPRLSIGAESASVEAKPAGSPLLSLVAQAVNAGEMAMAWQMIDFATRTRTSTKHEPRRTRAHIHRIATGAHPPQLVCVPSPVPPHGPGQYLRFANAMRGRHGVSVLSLPGYAPSEPLFETLDDLLACLAEAALECASGAPFAVLGYSGGGYLAYELGCYLERTGRAPVGIVLLDTSLQHKESETLDPENGLPYWRSFFDLPNGRSVAGRAMADGTTLGGVGEPSCDEELSAMARYHGWAVSRFVESKWSPEPGHTPVLMVSCSEDWNVPGTVIDLPPAARWHVSHELVKVPGNHFTFMGSHAAITADCVDAWLCARMPGDATPARAQPVALASEA